MAHLAVGDVDVEHPAVGKGEHQDAVARDGKRIGTDPAGFEAGSDVGGEAVEHLLVAEDAPDGLVLAAADFAEGVVDKHQPALFLQAGKAQAGQLLATSCLVGFGRMTRGEQRQQGEQRKEKGERSLRVHGFGVCLVQR